MTWQNPSDAEITRILTTCRRIALVGASAKPERPSHEVMGFLLRRGYDVMPVNPGLAGQQLWNRKVAASLADVTSAIDMVDVFRASDALPALVDEVLALPHKPKVLWTQLGVVHEDAAAKAQAHGIQVVMNRCPAIEIPRLGIKPWQ